MLYDDAGLRRVFYGSEGDLTRHADDTEYSWKAMGNNIEAEFGWWIVYSKPMWYGESQVTYFDIAHENQLFSS